MDDLSSSNGSTSPGYLHIQHNAKRLPKVFDFHSGRKCPTCGGTGKIPKGQDDELVALIPYKDKRLKPRKTWIYVIFFILCMCLAIALIVGVVLAALMYPRDVSVSISNSTQLDDYVSFKQGTDVSAHNVSQIILEIVSNVTIHNNNFFPVQVNKVNVAFSHLQVIVSNYSENESLTIPSRGSKEIQVMQNSTFKDSYATRLFTVCTGKNWKREVHLEIEVSTSYTYLSHGSDAVISTNTILLCDVNIPIHHNETSYS